MKRNSSDQFSEREANRRFEAALKGAFNTPPKPMKDIPSKRPRKQQKARKNAQNR